MSVALPSFTLPPPPPRRLDERERRRGFLLSRNLIRVKHFQGLDRRRTPQERETLARLRAFAR